MIIDNKYDTYSDDTVKIPLKPFVEDYYEDFIKIGILPGSIFCPQLRKSYAPITDNGIKYFNCQANDGIYLEINHTYEKKKKTSKAQIKKEENLLCPVEIEEKRVLFDIDQTIESLMFNIDTIMPRKKEYILSLAEKQQASLLRLHESIIKALEYDLENAETDEERDAIKQSITSENEDYEFKVAIINIEKESAISSLTICGEESEQGATTTTQAPTATTTQAPTATTTQASTPTTTTTMPPENPVPPIYVHCQKLLTESLDAWESHRKKTSSYLQKLKADIIDKNNPYYIYEKVNIKNVSVSINKKIIEKNQIGPPSPLTDKKTSILLGHVEELEEDVIDENGQIKKEKTLVFVNDFFWPDYNHQLYLGYSIDYYTTKMYSNLKYLNSLYQNENLSDIKFSLFTS